MGDVRVKVERLFRAMQPGKVEWRIHRPMQRAKELKKPLALKSECFSLQGLPQVQMEFFPNGHKESPEGMCVLRLLMPPGASVRYQCYLGLPTGGHRDFNAKQNLTVDCTFDDWREKLQCDGSLLVVLEVLQDKLNDDGSLTRVVHLENL